MLPITHQTKGAPIVWKIATRGSNRIDAHPGRVQAVERGLDDLGNGPTLVATVVLLVTAREENGGGTYPRIRNIQARHLQARTVTADTLVEGLDDLPFDALYEQAENAGVEFLANAAPILDVAAAAGTTEMPNFEDALAGI